MTSLLVFFHVSDVITLTHVKAIYSHPYFRMCISISQPVRNFGIVEFAGIAVFAGIAAFADFRRLKVIIVGEQSEPSVGRSMENFVLLLMPACGTYKYLSVYMCRRLEKHALEIARLVMMKKTTADSKSK